MVFFQNIFSGKLKVFFKKTIAFLLVYRSDDGVLYFKKKKESGNKLSFLEVFKILELL